MLCLAGGARAQEGFSPRCAASAQGDGTAQGPTAPAHTHCLGPSPPAVPAPAAALMAQGDAELLQPRDVPEGIRRRALGTLFILREMPRPGMPPHSLQTGIQRRILQEVS